MKTSRKKRTLRPRERGGLSFESLEERLLLASLGVYPNPLDADRFARVSGDGYTPRTTYDIVVRQGDLVLARDSDRANSRGEIRELVSWDVQPSPGSATIEVWDKALDDIVSEITVPVAGVNEVTPEPDSSSSSDDGPTSLGSADTSPVALVAPSSVQPGERIEVRISGLTPRTWVTLALVQEGSIIERRSDRVDRDGVATSRLRVPRDAMPLSSTVAVFSRNTDALIAERPIHIGAAETSLSAESVIEVPSHAVTPQPLFALPDFPENNRLSEGEWVRGTVAFGVGHSLFSVDVVYDGAIVHQKSTETDGTGAGTLHFQLPYRLLRHSEDGLEFRFHHAGKVGVVKFTLSKGLSISVSSEIREGDPFTYVVEHSAGETAVHAGINYDAGDNHRFDFRETDGSGFARITETMPRLIQNGASRDGAELWVRTKDVTWHFPITIIASPMPIDTKGSTPASVSQIVGVGGETLFIPNQSHNPAPNPSPIEGAAPVVTIAPAQLNTDLKNNDPTLDISRLIWFDWQGSLDSKTTRFLRGFLIDELLASGLKYKLESSGYECPTAPPWLFLVPGPASTIWVGLTCARGAS